MQAQTQVQTSTQPVLSLASDVESGANWSHATKIAFRFTFVYAVLNLICYQPFLGDFITLSTDALWKPIVLWVGKHILRIGDVPIIKETGSGDTTFAYVLGFTCLLISVFATVIWSLLDRKRINYSKLFEWLKLAVRFWLISFMTVYGASKLFPVQMQTPSLTKLVQQYGDFSPMGILWNFIGTSTTYQIFTGCIELLGGVLLIARSTILLGSLISLAAMTQVFVLNMCYDVPVKLFSFHLLLGAVFLLVPHMKRLADFFVLNRNVEPLKTVPLFNRARLNRGALIFQFILGLYLLVVSLLSGYQQYRSYNRAPNPPLYGIYSVEDFFMDDAQSQIASTIQWKRIIFDTYGRLYIQPMNGPNQGFSVKVDAEQKKLALAKRNDENWKTELSFSEPAPGQVVIEGPLDEHRYKARLVRVDESKFLLRSRGFNWIQEYPFNR
jgi:hypothetical protein